MSMNRQLRRAQEKQEKKLEKEREDRKAERRRRLNRYRAEREQARARRSKSRAANRKPASSGGEAGRGTAKAPARGADPGRFSGVLTIATVFFILMQSVVPAESERLFDSFVQAGFYLALGYFLHLWLHRRELPRAFVLTLVVGAMVLTGTWIGHLLRPDAPMDALGMLLSVPFLVLGTWLGQLVIRLAESQKNSS